MLQSQEEEYEYQYVWDSPLSPLVFSHYHFQCGQMNKCASQYFALQCVILQYTSNFPKKKKAISTWKQRPILQQKCHSQQRPISGSVATNNLASLYFSFNKQKRLGWGLPHGHIVFPWEADHEPTPSSLSFSHPSFPSFFCHACPLLATILVEPWSCWLKHGFLNLFLSYFWVFVYFFFFYSLFPPVAISS